MSLAKFLENAPAATGISDNMHSAGKRAQMQQNWMLVPTMEGVPPHINWVGGGDNQGYRVMPGRKKGVFNE